MGSKELFDEATEIKAEGRWTAQAEQESSWSR
jgi:hypothetical protein